MSVQSGQSVTVDFSTRVFSTGVATNADTLPTGTLVVNGTDNGATVTVTNKTTGIYKAAVTLPTLAIKDIVQIRINATVSSITDNGYIWADTKDVLLDASGDVTYNNAAPPTTAAIATAVWQDATPGDFTTASSIGNSLYTGNHVPGAANGLLIAGTNASTSFASGSHFIGTVDTVTTVTNQLTAAAIATGVWQDATPGDFTTASSIGKSLYTSGNAPGAASGLALVGSNMGTVTSVTGSVGSVTAAVTLTTNIRSGTAQAGAASTITLDAGASATDNLYQDEEVVITSGTGVGQTRSIKSYVGSTKVATIFPNWTTNPDATSVFTVIPAGQVDVGNWLNGTIPAVNVTGVPIVDVGDWLGHVVTVDTNNAPNTSSKYWAGTAITATSIPVATAAGASGGLVIAGSNAATTFASGSHFIGTVDTVTTVTNQLTAAAIATGIWQDSTPGDFTVASSIGNSLYTGNHAPGAASGLALVGSNMGTVTSVTGSVGSVTGAVGSVTAAVTLSVGDSQVIQSGTAGAGGASTITIQTALGTTADIIGCRIKITSGTGANQTRIITSYVNATKVVTVDYAWVTTPDNTSVYTILSDNAPTLNSSLFVTAVGSGTFTANVTQWNGTNVAAPATAGIPEVNVKNINNVSTSSVTTVKAVQGLTTADTITTYTGNTPQTGDAYAQLNTLVPHAFTYDGNNLPKVDLVDIAGSASTGAAGYVGVDWGQVTNKTTTNALTGTTISSAQTITSVSGSVGSVTGAVGSVTGAVGSVTGNVGGNVVGSVGSVTAAVTLSAGESHVIQSGTAAAGGASTITIQTALGTTADIVGCKVKITSGTGANQERVITSYVNSTKVVTVDYAWVTQPDATSVYTVLFDNAPLLNSSLYVTYSNAAAPTAASVATAVWQDTTPGDFTVASSIGNSLYTGNHAPGAASGLAIVGSQMDLVSAPNATAVTAFTVDALTHDWTGTAGAASFSTLNALRKVRNHIDTTTNAGSLTVFAENGTSQVYTQTLVTSGTAQLITSVG